MNKITCFTVLSCLLLFAPFSSAESFVVPMNIVSPYGMGESIGEITLTDSPKGLQIVPDLKHLPPGIHAIHVHENPSCEVGVKDNLYSSALAAGSHYDPEHTKKHRGPDGPGHAGDLPVIEVNPMGEAKNAILAPRLTIVQVSKRSIIIHEGGDNYSDDPKPLGGAGGRIACGVIP